MKLILNTHPSHSLVAIRGGVRAHRTDNYELNWQELSKNKRFQKQNPNFLANSRQYGALLVGLGLLLTFGGMLLFFERNLLRIGNISLLAGITLLIGPNNIRAYFSKKERLQASIITAIGIVLVLIGKPRIGIILEIFGILNLFGNMLPLLLTLAKSLPIVGDIIIALEAVITPTHANKRRQYEEPLF